jgi:transcriptional regulator with XRE-family HTH domain
MARRAGDAHYLRMLSAISKARGGDELRIRRVFAGLSQAEVAELAGMSQSRLSNYERCIHIPSEASRKKVLEAIGAARVPAVMRRI